MLRAKFHKRIAAIGAIMAAAGILCISAVSPVIAVSAETLNAYDQTKIEDDLKGVDLSAYRKDERALHCLIDGAGFMEYGYSNDMQIAGKYYGIYFYLYNPTAREISTRARANVANMAVAYDAAGNPTDYANIALTVLDHTDDHLIYKFRVTEADAILRREKEYAAAHGGERRYDVAGVQVWFAGDQNATDSRPGAATTEDREGVSFTYYCTGYAAGCGAGEESTLAVRSEKLDTIKLDVKHTFYRTMSSSLGNGHQNQLDTVYFTVPGHYFEQYGELQRIKAEWWEYKTNGIYVISSSELYDFYNKFVGYDFTQFSTHGYCFGEWGEEHGITQDDWWNFSLQAIAYDIVNVAYFFTMFDDAYIVLPTKDWCDIERYDPYADVEEIGGVSSSRLEQYLFGYDKSFNSGVVDCKDGKLSADLFADYIDDSRKINNERGKIQRGYSYYDFDVDADLQKIVTWQDADPSFWDNLWNYGLWDTIFGRLPEDTGRTVAPIYTLKSTDLKGSETEIAERIMVQSSDVDELRTCYEKAEAAGDQVIMFRFATSDYSVSRLDSGKAYRAQQSVFLNFDIIQLTFNDGENMTVIPVVSSPIDIVNPVTPPVKFVSDNFWTFVWIMCGIAGALIVTLVIYNIVKKAKGDTEE